MSLSDRRSFDNFCQLLTDETYSLISGEEGGTPDFKRYALLVTVLNHAYWVIGTAIGAAIGTLIPFDLRGIDFAMTALFITIYVEQWLTAKNKLAHIIGAGASLICLLIFGADGFLIPSMLAISALTFIFRRFIDTKDAKEAKK